jgi:hypothetical protein
MAMASTLNVFVDFLALSDGRDKMAKIFQYTAKILLHYAQAKKAGFVLNNSAHHCAPNAKVECSHVLHTHTE